MLFTREWVERDARRVEKTQQFAQNFGIMSKACSRFIFSINGRAGAPSDLKQPFLS